MSVLTVCDPNKVFTHLTDEEIISTMGLLPPWFEHTLNQDELSIWDSLDETYPFGLYEMKGGTVNEHLVYLYPGDPPLQPISVTSKGDKIIIFYQYAIVAMKESGEETYRVTRMD